MSSDFLFLLVAGAVAGGFVNGLAGFGTALFALGFWLQIMPPLNAVALCVVLSVASGLQGVWLVRKSIAENKRRLARFVAPALIGIPAGMMILALLDPFWLKMIVAGFLILYGGFFSLRSSLPKFQKPTPIVDSVVGFFGGVLGGAASLSGALPTMWCSMRPWPKAETRAVLQPYNVIVLGLTMGLFAVQGVYTSDLLWMIAITIPATLIAAQVGITMFKMLSDQMFRRLLILLMFISGILLVARELVF